MHKACQVQQAVGPGLDIDRTDNTHAKWEGEVQSYYTHKTGQMITFCS